MLWQSLDDAKSRDVRTRLSAIPELIGYPDLQATDALVDMLNDRVDEVRLTAARALAKKQDSRALTTLVKRMWTDEERLREVIIASLLALGHKPKSAADDVWFAIAQNDLTRAISYGPNAVGTLSDGFYRVAPWVQRRCLIVAAMIGDPRSIPMLLDALEWYCDQADKGSEHLTDDPGDSDPRSGTEWESVMECIRKALVGPLRSAALKPLIEMLSGDHASTYEAAALLGRIGDPRATEHLLSALMVRGRSKDGIDRLIRALGDLGDPCATSALVAYLRTYDHERAATRALRQIGRDAVPELERHADAPDALFRDKVSRLLYYFGCTPSAREPVGV
jgi:HEAT repeat protein